MDLKKVEQIGSFDAVKSVEGVEVPYSEDFVLRVARFGNDKFQALMRELSSTPECERWKLCGMWDKPENFPEVKARQKEIMLECWARTVLVGWTGLQDNGVDVPYSPDIAKKLLEVDDVFARVSDIARGQEMYRRELIKGASEVLGKP